jgi:hypothetical protein
MLTSDKEEEKSYNKDEINTSGEDVPLVISSSFSLLI